METKISGDLGTAVYEQTVAARFLQDILHSASILSRMSFGGISTNEGVFKRENKCNAHQIRVLGSGS
jgi:hypothetical protein